MPYGLLCRGLLLLIHKSGIMKFIFVLLFSLSLSLAFGAENPLFPQLDYRTNKWHYIDASGTIVLKITLPDMEDLMPFSDGMAAAKNSCTSLWGFINTEGEWQIQPQYQDADSFKDGYSIVSELCKVDCRTAEDGITNENIKHVIDLTGKILLTDFMQEENDEKYFFNKNLGHGFFSVTLNYLYFDALATSIVDVQGHNLLKADEINNSNTTIFDEELEACRYANRYYNLQQQKVLDLSHYNRVGSFSEGYVWAEIVEMVSWDEFDVWTILIDNTGKEILTLGRNLPSDPSPVEEGEFIYHNEEGEEMTYNLKTKQSVPHQTIEYNTPIEIHLGRNRTDGSKFNYDRDFEHVTGLLSTEGKFFPKYINLVSEEEK